MCEVEVRKAPKAVTAEDKPRLRRAANAASIEEKELALLGGNVNGARGIVSYVSVFLGYSSILTNRPLLLL